MLTKFKLRLHGPKYRFGCSESRYLDHVISTHGNKTDTGKVSAILGFPTSYIDKQVITFLQPCSQYRKFILPVRPDRTAPQQTDPPRRQAPWEWGSQQEEAFKEP